MTAPLDLASLLDAIPLPPRRAGERSVGLLLALHCRSELLRAARRRFFAGLSDRAAAGALHAALRRYAMGGWRRDRIESTCPDRLRGRLEETCWMILTLRDADISIATVRRALFVNHGARSDRGEFANTPRGKTNVRLVNDRPNHQR